MSHCNPVRTKSIESLEFDVTGSLMGRVINAVVFSRSATSTSTCQKSQAKSRAVNTFGQVSHLHLPGKIKRSQVPPAAS